MPIAYGACSPPRARALCAQQTASEKQLVDTLNAALVQALGNTDVREAMQRAGAEPTPSTPTECAGHLKAEIAKWTAVIERAGIRPE